MVVGGRKLSLHAPVSRQNRPGSHQPATPDMVIDDSFKSRVLGQSPEQHIRKVVALSPTSNRQSTTVGRQAKSAISIASPRLKVTVDDSVAASVVDRPYSYGAVVCTGQERLAVRTERQVARPLLMAD